MLGGTRQRIPHIIEVQPDGQTDGRTRSPQGRLHPLAQLSTGHPSHTGQSLEPKHMGLVLFGACHLAATGWGGSPSMGCVGGSRDWACGQDSLPGRATGRDKPERWEKAKAGFHLGSFLYVPNNLHTAIFVDQDLVDHDHGHRLLLGVIGGLPGLCQIDGSVCLLLQAFQLVHAL